MMIDLCVYDLPDAVLLDEQEECFRFLVWEPEWVCVILGQSNRIDLSVNVENVLMDGIRVYKRPSGGESVVISPNTLAISILKMGDSLISPKIYFEKYNERIIRALEALGVLNLSMEGISDISVGKVEKRKILGSSIYRNKDRILYHAILNRAENGETLERYLKPPLRQPEYRYGRSHSEFVTSLEKEGYRLDVNDIKNAILKELTELHGDA